MDLNEQMLVLVGPLGDNRNPIKLIRYKKVMVPNILSCYT